MRDRSLTVSRPRTPQHLRPEPSQAPSRRSHRRLLLITIAVATVLVLPSMAVSAAGRNPVPAQDAQVSVAGPCTRTVGGLNASAVHSARDAAGAGGIVCFPAGTYSGDLHASIPGQTWKLDNAATLTGAVTISGAKVKLLGGNILRTDPNRWTASVQIRAHDVTIQSVNFHDGGTGVNVLGKDRSRILSNSFRNLTGSAISIWSEGVGADRTLISKNKIVQTATIDVSPITSRGNESGDHGGVQNYRTVIRRNTIDQGPAGVGWFGIELKQSKNAIIERNTIKGGLVLVSLPETDNALIRYNTFDLRGTAHWGIEVGNAHDAVIDANTFIGDGRTSADYGITLNSGSLRTHARRNSATHLRTFFGIAGDGHRVMDNCLRRSVRFVQEWMLNGGPNIVFARNRRC